MYIKTITISGFKSYRDQITVDPFSPRHNVIVGRNGSGKSNFFMAIRFVLSDAYTSLTREERQRLLHEGSSTTTTLSAFVEIVFDNSDGRFPTSLLEMRLRRTIGLKKDEYSLDKKSVTKAEVMNLLESAGFSRSNPYYIVPQGRITGLTNMSDKERLNLLKEVAGTKVYEQKRSESVRIMDETGVKRQQIKEVLETIETRLSELESEKEELKEYQEKDKERRCLEYALHSRELEDVTSALDQIEEDRRNDVHISNEQRRDFNKREVEIQRLEEELTKAKHSLSTVAIALRQYEAEMADLVRERTEIECVIEDFQQAGEGGEARRLEISQELEALEARVAEATARLVDLGADLEERVNAEREAKQSLETTQSQLQVLYDKQGRARQFNSKAARDQFLDDEIQQLRAYEEQQQRTIDELQTDIEGAKSQLAEASARVEEQNREEEERRNRLKQMSEELNRLRARLDVMTEQRKELWREDGKLSQSVSNAKVELDAAERLLQGMMDKDTSNGLRAVREITRELNLEGVHGALYELFEVSDRYKACVEVVAGTSLFHVVVDNDETATRLLEVMYKRKSGRVTFMPLNRLKSSVVQYPQASDAIPMISRLKFDRAYVMAMEQVFGRTIICEDLNTAAQYTRSHALNAVTVEGDRVDRKGSLTGGYHDVRRSRLDAVRLVKRWREAYESDSARHAEVKSGLSRLEQEISSTMGNIQRLESRRKAMLDDRMINSRQANWTLREEEQARQRLIKLEMALQEAEVELRGAITKRTALEEERRSPMRQQLSNQEQQQMEALTREAEVQKQTLLEASLERQRVSTERSELEIELTESLRRRREELRAQLDEIEGEVGAGVLQDGDVELRKVELANLVRAVEELSGQVKASEEEVERLNGEIAEKTSRLDELQIEQMESTRAIVRVQKNAERYLAKRQTLVSRKEECTNAIRDLGVLPEEAYSKYIDLAADKIVKRLHKIHEGLKKFAHVNKKAFEQYNNFTKQRDDLLKRQEELEASASSIQDLIETLDQRKDEAIERTFKQVSKYFEEVFEKLVPAGKGVLVMQKKMEMFEEEETEESVVPLGREKSEIDNYTGVSIKVSFNSKQDEGQRIQQLSGGQKSLVALATVFAIQKCDPAPFYLFDEIDANLDSQYRTAVADMIHSLSDTAQFITTTFRGEMLTHADKFYGVYFDKSKVSSIQTVTREEAQQFIENAAA